MTRTTAPPAQLPDTAGDPPIACEMCGSTSIRTMTRLCGHRICESCRWELAYLFAREHDDWLELGRKYHEQ